VTENKPIPVADHNNKETIHNNDEEIIIEQQGDTQDNTITGVDENDQNAHTNKNYTQEPDLEDTQDNTHTKGRNK